MALSARRNLQTLVSGPAHQARNIGTGCRLRYRARLAVKQAAEICARFSAKAAVGTERRHFGGVGARWNRRTVVARGNGRGYSEARTQERASVGCHEAILHQAAGELSLAAWWMLASIVSGNNHG